MNAASINEVAIFQKIYWRVCIKTHYYRTRTSSSASYIRTQTVL